MRKRFATLVSAGSAVLAVAAPTAASAEETRVTEVPGAQGVYEFRGGNYLAAAWQQCNGGTCFFQHSYGNQEDSTARIWVVPSCGRHLVPRPFEDKASSVWNRTPTTIWMYKDRNFNSGSYMGSWGGWGQGNLAAHENDKLSAVDARC
ncbi:peptidase inhibitor family I36 protein [Streptomyces sp. NPDC017941]|uniref:peptidase inhibitor family I36 protein n=1 Tax=Streptomyces sp. NPDC017941 TaxID=3365018 RepID=UPI0037B6E9BA